jgi:rhomboid protease GluP
LPTGQTGITEVPAGSLFMQDVIFIDILAFYSKMNFNNIPEYQVDYPFDNLSVKEFLIIALEAAKSLGWNTGIVNSSGFQAFAGDQEIIVNIHNVIAVLSCRGADNDKNESIVSALVSAINETRIKLSAEEIENRYRELETEFADVQEVHDESYPATKKAGTGIINIFRPVEGYFITPIIIDLNILVFILMVATGVDFMKPDIESLMRWGADFRPSVLEGEWWRLFTSTFIHIGFIHLLMNMYALMYIGLLLEPLIGRTRFLGAYIITGLTGSLASIWWHDLTVGAGASGAIFGMYGLFLAMLTTNLIEKSARQSLLTSIAIFIGYNLLSGARGEVDNAAHIGGLACGLLMGYSFYPGMVKPSERNKPGIIIGVFSILVIAIAFILIKTLPNDMGVYQEKMKTFATLEDKALEVFNLPEGTSKEKIMAEIKDPGIRNWNECGQLLTDISALKLTPEIHERNEKIMHYVELRVASYNLMYKAMEEDTRQYQDSIDYYNKEIQAEINSLK